MAEFFGSDSSDSDGDDCGGGGGGPPDSCHPAVRSTVVTFISSRFRRTETELREGGAGAVADRLVEACEAMVADGFADGRSAAGPAARAVEDATWSMLDRGKGWPHVCWHEAFVFSQMILACWALANPEEEEEEGEEGEGEEKTKSGGGGGGGDDSTTTSGGPVGAMYHVDRAFVLGGPKKELNIVARIVDPMAVRSGGGGGGGSGSGWGDAGAGDSAGEPPLVLLLPGRLPSASLVPVPEIGEAGPPIERLDEPIDPATFRDAYFKRSRPVVMAGLAAGWAALGKWRDLAYFDRVCGHRVVPIEIGRHHEGEGRWTEKTITIGRFLREYVYASSKRCSIGGGAGGGDGGVAEDGSKPVALPPADRVAYLAQHELFDQLPTLKRDFTAPTAYYEAVSGGGDAGSAGGASGGGGSGGLRVHAWFGTDGTVTPLHYDSYDNLFVQVVGFKYVRLYEPAQARYLHLGDSGGGKKKGAAVGSGDGGGEKEANAAAPASSSSSSSMNVTMAQRNISPVNVEQLDAATEFPEFAHATCTETILGPGDTLFIPDGTWHYVRALSPSFSVSFMWS